MLTADELRRLREAATPGPLRMSGQRKELFDGDAYAYELESQKDACWVALVQDHRLYSATKPGQANADFIAYLWNHAAAIEEALRELAVYKDEEMMEGHCS